MPLTLYRSILVAALIVSASFQTHALKKPETLDEMWQIIQAQQKQIQAMQVKLEAAEKSNSDNKVNDLERKTTVLSEEVEKLRTELVIPDDVELKSTYGLGPAASKVYQVDKGLSIGGYGEANYQVTVNDEIDKKDNADFERLVLYIGYKFTEDIIFNSEIEFEHASTSNDGSVSVEFAALDFFIDPIANIRAGLVLLPVGFINSIHEPPFYFGNNRPEVERRIIPSTWREIGVGLFGEITPEISYSTYAVNGLDAKGFESSGIRGGRQKGSRARAEDLAFVGRVDYSPFALAGLTIGASAYVGNSGQNQTFAGQKVDALTQLYEGHVEWKYRGWEFRALGAWSQIDDAGVLSADLMETIGEQAFGWYTELGYDVLPLIFPETRQYLAPFFRYEQFDTIASAPSGFADDGHFDREIFQVGLQYKPIPNVVIKADYRNFVAEDGRLPDDFNLGIGFIF